MFPLSINPLQESKQKVTEVVSFVKLLKKKIYICHCVHENWLVFIAQGETTAMHLKFLTIFSNGSDLKKKYMHCPIFGMERNVPVPLEKNESISGRCVNSHNALC